MREHQCTHPGGCGSEAQWALDLKFHTIGLGDFRHEIKCHSTIRVCGRHTQPAVARLMSQTNRQRIATWLTRQNLPLPDFGSFEITWQRVDHERIDEEILNAQLESELMQ